MDESPGRFPPPPRETPGSPPRWGASGPQGFYPLDAGRLVQLTLGVFRFRRLMFIGIVLAFEIPVALANGLLQAVTVASIARSTQEMIAAVERGETTVSALLRLIPWDAFLLTWASSAILGFLGILGAAAAAVAAARVFSGLSTTLSESIRTAVSRIIPLAVVYLIPLLVSVAVLVVGGTVAVSLLMAGSLQSGPLGFLGILVVVAALAVLLFLGVRWSLAIPVVMLEKLGGRAALGRSWRLVAGSSWRVLGYSLLFELLVGVPLMLMSLVVTTILGSGVEESPVGLVADSGEAFLSTFVIGALSAILAPIIPIAMTILYFDLRSRNGEQVPVPGQPPQSVPEQKL